jgi:hypothetical protein
MWRVWWYTPLIRRVLIRTIGFINRLQLVTTNNYNTVPDFYSTSTPRQFSESIPTCIYYPFPGNGSQHKNYHRLTLQILHVNLLFTETFFTPHAGNSTDNCSHGVFFINEHPTVFSHLELSDNCLITPTANSYKPFIWHARKRFNCCVTADSWRLVTLPHSCVIQVFIAVAWQQTRRGDATRWATRHDSARLGSARFCSVRHAENTASSTVA